MNALNMGPTSKPLRRGGRGRGGEKRKAPTRLSGYAIATAALSHRKIFLRGPWLGKDCIGQRSITKSRQEAYDGG